MSKRNLAIAAVQATFALAAFSVTAWSAEVQYNDSEWCGHAKRNVLVSSPDLAVWAQEAWGIGTAERKSDPFRLFTVRCVSYSQVVKGNSGAQGSCSFTDPDGDTFTGLWTSGTGQPNTWTFVVGTGKWKGIQGDGTWRAEPGKKPFPDGTAAYCVVHSGKYTLPQ